MTNMEALTSMFNSDNAPVIAGIGGIVFLVCIDRAAKSCYRIEGKKDSITIEPAATANQQELSPYKKVSTVPGYNNEHK